MRLLWTDAKDAAFISLTDALDATFRDQLGERQKSFDTLNRLPETIEAVLVYDGDRAVACAALKPFDAEAAELKRVYVQPEYRRQGLAAQLLEAIEAKAASLGYTRLLLETNPTFLPAVALYRNAGFVPVDAFGPYVGMNTLCMCKQL